MKTFNHRKDKKLFIEKRTTASDVSRKRAVRALSFPYFSYLCNGLQIERFMNRLRMLLLSLCCLCTFVPCAQAGSGPVKTSKSQPEHPSHETEDALSITHKGAPFPAMLSYGDEPFVSTRPSTSSEYQVKVNGKPITVWTAKGDGDGGIYYIAQFDTKEAAQVEVVSARPLTQTELLPARYGIEAQLTDAHTLTFRADAPFHLVLEPDGRRKALLLFANRPETDVPSVNDPNVIYYGPGVHHAGLLELKEGQTLYLAEGAVVNACVLATGDHITVCGRGILTGDDWPRFGGPNQHMVSFHRGHDITVRDIIITNPWTWSLVAVSCNGVLFDNVKVCASNMINDDAVDLCNSQNVTVQNCFLRAQDDIIAIKGIDYGDGLYPCKNITVKDCEMWTNRANVFRIGYECRAPHMSHITGSNLDIIHYSDEYRDPTHYWSNCVFWLQPSNGMTLSDCHFDHIRIHADKTDFILVEAKSCLTGDGSTEGYNYNQGGSVRDISFQDISVYAPSYLPVPESISNGTSADSQAPSVGKGQLWFEGRNENETIENISFSGVTLFGTPVTATSAEVTCKDFVKNITFKE